MRVVAALLLPLAFADRTIIVLRVKEAILSGHGNSERIVPGGNVRRINQFYA